MRSEIVTRCSHLHTLLGRSGGGGRATQTVCVRGWSEVFAHPQSCWWPSWDRRNVLFAATWHLLTTTACDGETQSRSFFFSFFFLTAELENIRVHAELCLKSKHTHTHTVAIPLVRPNQSFRWYSGFNPGRELVAFYAASFKLLWQRTSNEHFVPRYLARGGDRKAGISLETTSFDVWISTLAFCSLSSCWAFFSVSEGGKMYTTITAIQIQHTE